MRQLRRECKNPRGKKSAKGVRQIGVLVTQTVLRQKRPCSLRQTPVGRMKESLFFFVECVLEQVLLSKQ